MVFFNEKSVLDIIFMFTTCRYIMNTFRTYRVYNIILLNIIVIGARRRHTEGDESSKKLFEKT